MKFTYPDVNNLILALIIWGTYFGGAQANTNGQDVWKGMLVGAASGAAGGIALAPQDMNKILRLLGETAPAALNIILHIRRNQVLPMEFIPVCPVFPVTYKSKHMYNNTNPQVQPATKSSEKKRTQKKPV